MVDFSECKIFHKTYGGANGNKLCISYNDKKYMLKFPAKPTKETELSYANGCISEYIGCHIYNMLGIEAQETILGTYIKDEKEKIVVACEDMTTSGLVIQDFASLKNTVIDSLQNGYGTELSDILNAIEEQQFIDSTIVKKRFWDMFVCDSLLGNFDRHNGNWGFLYNPSTDEIKLAPVYDCGSCLYPQADKEIMELVLNEENERNARIYNFPTSAIKIDNKKISYIDFLSHTDNKDCLLSLENIRNQYIEKQKDIFSFISNIECLDDLQTSFYKTMLTERFEKIIEPVYTHHIQNEQTLDEEELEL